MENEEKKNQTPEVRDEELDQVSGGVIIQGKCEEKSPVRREVSFQYKTNPEKKL